MTHHHCAHHSMCESWHVHEIAHWKRTVYKQLHVYWVTGIHIYINMCWLNPIVECIMWTQSTHKHVSTTHHTNCRYSCMFTWHTTIVHTIICVNRDMCTGYHTGNEPYISSYMFIEWSEYKFTSNWACWIQLWNACVCSIHVGWLGLAAEPTHTTHKKQVSPEAKLSTLFPNIHHRLVVLPLKCRGGLLSGWYSILIT